jgi:hypothetical protein
MKKIETLVATTSPHMSVSADPPEAWEMVAEGRYQPRRIRGSLRGRQLG